MIPESIMTAAFVILTGKTSDMLIIQNLPEKKFELRCWEKKIKYNYANKWNLLLWYVLEIIYNIAPPELNSYSNSFERDYLTNLTAITAAHKDN